jgi:DNA-directed RNA polymerase specialized sigma subunit
VGTRIRRWCRYTWVFLTRLGYDYTPDTRTIIAYVIRELRSSDFDFSEAEEKLAKRRFRRSVEQQQTSQAIRRVLFLETEVRQRRRRGRTVNLSDRDVANVDLQADPLLQCIQKESMAKLMAVLETLSPRDQDILYMRGIERATFRQIADELQMPLASVYNRLAKLQVIVASRLTQSRNEHSRA